jgi:hypothetical protein
MFHIALGTPDEVVRTAVVQCKEYVHDGEYRARTCSECLMASVAHYEDDACPMCATEMVGALRSTLARSALACGVPYMALAVLFEGIQRELQGDMALAVVRGEHTCDAYVFAALVASQGEVCSDMSVTSVGTPSDVSWLPHHFTSVDELATHWTFPSDLVVVVLDVRSLVQVYERVRPAFIVVASTNERMVRLDSNYTPCCYVLEKTEYADKLDFAYHALILFRRIENAG